MCYVVNPQKKKKKKTLPDANHMHVDILHGTDIAWIHFAWPNLCPTSVQLIFFFIYLSLC